MAKRDKESDKEKEDGEVSAEDEKLNGLNTPDIDPETGKPKNKAVASFRQAYSICKRRHDAAENGRLKINAQIARKYAGESPYENARLRATGQGWRHNFSTNPLASTVDRATPQLKDPIRQAESLTYSRLPSYREDANEKTRKFRERTSRLIRSWSAWDDFIDQITQDNYLYGNTAPGWLDDDWRPAAFRTNEVFLPEGSAQHASKVQTVVFRKSFTVQEFLKKIDSKEIAEAAGYNWEGCLKAVEEAAGISSDRTQSEFERVDRLRENAEDKDYDEQQTVVRLYYLLVHEYEGGMAMWVTSEKGGHAIRHQKDIFDSPEDAVSLFTLQAGNNRFYGSKGAGRLLGNLHTALDRSRCFNADKLYVAGLPIFHVQGKDVNSVNMTLRTPFMYVVGEVQLMQETVTFDANAAEYQDNKLVALMEETAGAFIPPKLQDSGTPNTKIEAAEKAQRELAVRNGVLGRFFRQFGDLIGAMQRKIYRPEHLKEALRIFEEAREKEQTGIRVIASKLFKWVKEVIPDIKKSAAPMGESKECDPDAIEAIIDLLKDGLSIEEISELALSPAANSVAEQPEQQEQKIVETALTLSGSPLAAYVNWEKAAKKVVSIQMGEDVAEELLNHKPDPNDEAWNVADEMTDWLFIQQGEARPIPQNQNHRVRRAVLATRLQPIINTLIDAPTPELLQVAMVGVPHYGGHLQADRETPPDQLQQEIQSFQMMEDAVLEAQKKLEQLAKQAAQVGAQSPNDLPPQMPGTPMGVNPEGSLEAEKLAADTAIKAEQIKIKNRELDIRERENERKAQQHEQQLILSTGESIADKVAQAGREGERSAQEAIARQNELERQQQAQHEGL